MDDWSGNEHQSAGGGGGRIDVKMLGPIYDQLIKIGDLLKEISPSRQMSEAEIDRITAEVRLRASLALSVAGFLRQGETLLAQSHRLLPVAGLSAQLPEAVQGLGPN